MHFVKFIHRQFSLDVKKKSVKVPSKTAPTADPDDFQHLSTIQLNSQTEETIDSVYSIVLLCLYTVVRGYCLKTKTFNIKVFI